MSGRYGNERIVAGFTPTFEISAMKHILFEMHHLKDLIVWAFKLDQTIINSFNDKNMWVQYHKNVFSRIGWALQIWLTYILL